MTACLTERQAVFSAHKDSQYVKRICMRGSTQLNWILECKHVSLATLFVILPQFLLVFLVIGFTSRNKVLEEHAVIYDLDVEDEECTEASDTDAVDVVIADKLLAVGNLIQACCVLDLKNRALDGVQCLARQLAD